MRITSLFDCRIIKKKLLTHFELLKQVLKKEKLKLFVKNKIPNQKLTRTHKSM